MAKRRASSSSRSRSSVRKTARGGARQAGKSTRKAAASRQGSTKGTARKTSSRKTSRAGAAKKTAARKATARKTSAKPAARKAAGSSRSSGRKTTRTTPRTAPSLDRPRRTVAEEDIFPTPPSSLDMDRTASAVRTGRREMKEKRDELTQTSPALTGGDVDADWESAYSVGDEAPGGDNPTPDQDIVDDIGRAVGVEYEDNEELKGADKVAKRDRHRWELDPASSEDYNDRD
jgi:Family of unknown function (DUF6335)